MGTEAISAPAAAPPRRRAVPGWGWLRQHDPGYGALRRATRTALIMPAMFAIGDKVIANPVLATFAAFGSFAMLLLVDFQGPVRHRVLAQGCLVVACAVLICLGTLASRFTVVATLGMALVGFAVCSRAWSARCWPAPPPRCCWPSSCRCRCRDRSPRSLTVWPAGACRERPRCWRSRSCGPRQPATWCERRRSTPAGRWPLACAPRSRG